MLDVPCRRFGIRIVPGCIRILLPIYQQGVISGLPLPWAARRRRAWSQELPLHRLFRKVHVPLDHLVGVTLSESVAVPYRLRHVNALAFFSMSSRSPSTAGATHRRRDANSAFVTERSG